MDAMLIAFLGRRYGFATVKIYEAWWKEDWRIEILQSFSGDHGGDVTLPEGAVMRLELLSVGVRIFQTQPVFPFWSFLSASREELMQL